MKSTFKARTLALISIVSTVFATGNIALANDRVDPTGPIKVSTPIGCSLEPNKEFQSVVRVKNTTNQTIGSGKSIFVRVYYYGKIQGKTPKYLLPKSLAPGQSIRTGNYISAETSANYTCKASY
jgi:hypothetical protein